MRYYRLSGLTVATELDFPGGIPVSAAAPDVTAGLAELPPCLATPCRKSVFWSLDERSFLFDLPDIGRFMARDGRELLMQPAEGMATADALPFLLGTTFGALLYQRGTPLLHASAVVRGGCAYAFGGRSGIGKSTLAAALGRDGTAFASMDDGSSYTLRASRLLGWRKGRGRRCEPASRNIMSSPKSLPPVNRPSAQFTCSRKPVRTTLRASPAWDRWTQPNCSCGIPTAAASPKPCSARRASPGKSPRWCGGSRSICSSVRAILTA